MRDRVASPPAATASGAHDGLVVFVPRTAPGDVVARRRSTRARRLRARARCVACSSRRPTASTPPCPHYDARPLRRLPAAAPVVRGAAGGEAAHRRATRCARIGRRDVGDVAGARRARRSGAIAASSRSRCAARGERWIAGLHRVRRSRARLRPRRTARSPTSASSPSGASCCGAPRFCPRAPALRGAVRLTARTAPSFVLEGGTPWPHARAFVDAVPSLATSGGSRQAASALVARSRLRRAPRRAHAGASFAQVNARSPRAARARARARAARTRPRRWSTRTRARARPRCALAARGRRASTAIELDAEAARWCARAPAGRLARRSPARVEDVLAERAARRRRDPQSAARRGRRRA